MGISLWIGPIRTKYHPLDGDIAYNLATFNRSLSVSHPLCGNASGCQIYLNNPSQAYPIATPSANVITKSSQDIFLLNSSFVADAERITKLTVTCDHNQTEPYYYNSQNIENPYPERVYNLDIKWNCLSLHVGSNNEDAFHVGRENNITVRGNYLSDATLSIGDDLCDNIATTINSLSCVYTPSILKDYYNLTLVTSQRGIQYFTNFTIRSFSTVYYLHPTNFTKALKTSFPSMSTLHFLSGEYECDSMPFLFTGEVTLEAEEGAYFTNQQSSNISIVSSAPITIRGFKNSLPLLIRAQSITIDDIAVDTLTIDSQSLYVHASSISQIQLNPVVNAIFDAMTFKGDMSWDLFDSLQFKNCTWMKSVNFLPNIPKSVNTIGNTFRGSGPELVTPTIWNSYLDSFESISSPITSRGRSNITIQRATFTSGGKSIDVEGDYLRIEDSQFSKVEVSTIITNNATIEIFRSTFSSNTSPLSLSNSNSYLESSIFFRNTATDGGSIVIVGGNTSIFNSIFESNTANRGGALFVGLNAPTYVKNCTFKGNNVKALGGAIYYDTTNRGLNRRDLNDFVILDISNSIFSGNTAVGIGGALHLFNSNGGSISITSSVFENNLSSNGNSFTLDGRVDLIDSDLTKERLDKYSIFVTGSSTLNATGTSFGRNVIYLSSPSLSFTLVGASVSAVQCIDGFRANNSGNAFGCTRQVVTNENSFPTGMVVGIVVGCSVLLILLILVAVFVVMRTRNRKKDDQETEMDVKVSSLQNVTVGQLIGEGNFGEVYVGTWDDSTVALKCLTMEAAGTDAEKQWKEEIRVLSLLNHPNVVRLWGLFSQGGKVFMVMEYAAKGSLSSYLRKSRDQKDGTNYTNIKKNAIKDEDSKRESKKDLEEIHLSEEDLTRMCFETARGMRYLERVNVIHRDLAARNILLDDRLHIKISDFGMSRENSIYSSKEKTLPYRWCAPEVILEGRSSSKSDVWAFGVVMYEIFTHSALPFADLSNDQIRSGFKNRHPPRLERPLSCPVKLWGLAEQCWEWDPENRPNFSGLCDSMVQLFPSLNSQVIKERDSKMDEGIYLTK